MNIGEGDYVFETNVPDVRWDPTSIRLLVFTESHNIFEWSPNSAVALPTPKGINITDAQWHPHGKTVALYGYNKAAIYHVTGSLV